MKALLVLGLSLTLCTAPATAQLNKWKEKVGLEKQDGVSESDTVSGLKEALRVGAENAIKLRDAQRATLVTARSHLTQTHG